MPEPPLVLDAEHVEDRVLQIVAGLAKEVAGDRAARAVAPQASLEREVGFGSLERVELLLRLETAFGRALDDRFLGIDTVRDLAGALLESAASQPLSLPAREPQLAAAPRARGETLHELLWRRAEENPDRPHAFVREDDGREHVVSYGTLLADARAIAGALAERGVARGDRVALMLPTGVDFLACFQAILLARAVPVPIYPPLRLDRLEEYARRQSAILADAGVKLLATIPRALPIAGVLRPRVPSLAVVTTAAELRSAGAGWPAPSGRGEDAAFIQYTSGSTGHPKGVLLSHANLLANIRAIGAGVGLKPTDVGVSWLPLYHDMGLIGSWLFCLVEALPIDIQSPLAFLARPERWLWAIHRRRGTLSAAPNFAYELCARKIPDSALEGLDLSSWRCALSGAEPVNPDTLERFARRFAPCGLRREALMPVYGLAENSVALCFPPWGRAPKVDRVQRLAFERERRAEPTQDADGLRFVSVGTALPEHAVRILGDDGAELADRAVGRLAFRGPSMMAGYFGNPEATAAITLPDGWLDSGDLAYRAEGEIYIAGRLKDLIIKAGRNLVPQEIEEVVAEIDGIRKGCVVAFGAARRELGTESLVVVAETREPHAGARDLMARAVTERVAEAIGVPPDAVAIVDAGAIPKTSSGKLRRAATRELYESGRLGRSSRAPLWVRSRIVLQAVAAEAWQRLRPLARATYAVYAALLVLIAAPAVWLLALVVPRRHDVARLSRATCRLLMRALGCRLSAEGLEHLPPGGGLLAANHASYADVPALLALLPVDFVFVAKKEVRRWPLVGTFVRRAGHLTVDRYDAREGVADTARVAEATRNGERILMFPEGTFMAATGLRPFRLGTFKSAVDTATPVCPLALSGTRRVLRGESWLPHPGPIHLWVGPAVAPEGEGLAAVVALRERVAQAIADHCGEPRLDLIAGGPLRP